jgi:hypothetical protein
LLEYRNSTFKVVMVMVHVHFQLGTIMMEIWSRLVSLHPQWLLPFRLRSSSSQILTASPQTPRFAF